MSTDSSMQACALQVSSGALDKSIITPHGPYLLLPHHDSVVDLVSIENLGAPIEVVPIHSTQESALDLMAAVISDPVHQPRSAMRVVSPAAGVSSPGAHLKDDSHRLSVPGSPAPSP
jgi:hypothetical protein